jgi:hypothetical protein
VQEQPATRRLRHPPSSSRPASSAAPDSDAAFLAKLLLLSFAGEPPRCRAAALGERALRAWGLRCQGHEQHTRALARLAEGGAASKYGTLLIDVPFQPSAALALAVVLGVPAA